MSWQSDFDSAGPKWAGSAAAVAEEKRLRKMMDEIKSRVAEQSKTMSDASVFENLDQEMVKLYEREQELVRFVESASSEEEINAIKSHLSKVRSHFHELRNEYKRLK